MKQLTIKSLIFCVALLFAVGCEPQASQQAVTPTQPQLLTQAQPETDLEIKKTGPAVPKIVEQQVPAPDVVSSEPQESELADPERAESGESEPETETEPQPQDQLEISLLYVKFNRIFTNYVDEGGMVDYQNLRRKRVELITTARLLDNLHPAEYLSWSRNEKIAFWINAYNLFTLKLIVDNYPIEPLWYMIIYPDNSIMQIPGRWTKTYFKVMGMEYTLAEIENELLLDRFKDPRICFGLSYASMSSAVLRDEAYFPDRLSEQLDQQITKFLAKSNALRIDHANKVIHLSDIFNWYKPIFLESEYARIKKFRQRQPHIRAYLNFIANYIKPEAAKCFESDSYTIDFQTYDWHLNEQ